MMTPAVLLDSWRQMRGDQAADPSPDPLQRPLLRLPGLRATPWWDAAAFPWTQTFEASVASIRDECRQLLESGELIPKPIAQIPPPERRGDQQLIDGERGGWDIWRLLARGGRMSANCARCPATSAALDRVPALTGTVGFGVLLPGTHLVPHCGLTNAKLRAHFGLQVPPRCRMRVGAETRAWANGEWLFFDDSFEHEVWNEGTDVRIVFMLDVYHPDLSPQEIAWLEEAAARLPPAA